MHNHFHFLFLMLFSLHLFAQGEKEYVNNAFRSIQLINSQTTETVTNQGWDFSIKHRFGGIGPDSTLYKQFLGLDLPANIRFGFAFPIFSDLYAGIGRTKNGKTTDFEIKYKFLKQTEENEMPLSAALYINVALNGDDFPRVPTHAFFQDSVTPFQYSFNHRLSYNYQLILSKRINDNLAIQMSCVYLYRNLVKPLQENQTLTIPFGVSLKTGIKSSVLAEYALRFNNRPVYNQYPLSIAWESGTAGHTFQIVVSSTSELLEQVIHTSPSYEYRKGKLAFGFNIRRTFWYKRYKTTAN